MSHFRLRHVGNFAVPCKLFVALMVISSCGHTYADVRPIKLVQRASQALWMSEDLRGMQEMCNRSKGAVGRYPAFLTDEYIRQHSAVITTTWYEGKKQAEFTVGTSFVLDFERRCAIVATRNFTAAVQADCDVKYSASNLAGAGLSYGPREKGRDACFLDRDSKTFVETYKKVTLEDGTPCLLNPLSPAGKGIKDCLYPKVPFYMGHAGRPVAFRFGEEEVAGRKTPRFSIEELRDGDIKVPPNIFTEQAVREWVNRPTSEVLQ